MRSSEILEIVFEDLNRIIDKLIAEKVVEFEDMQHLRVLLTEYLIAKAEGK